VNVNDLATPIDSSSEMNLKRSIKATRDALYYRFAHFEENHGLDRDELMFRFFDNYDIRFVIIEKDAETPQAIVTNAKNIFQDSLSGEKFIELNN
jgi:hypothetical protein